MRHSPVNLIASHRSSISWHSWGSASEENNRVREEIWGKPSEVWQGGKPYGQQSEVWQGGKLYGQQSEVWQGGKLYGQQSEVWQGGKQHGQQSEVWQGGKQHGQQSEVWQGGKQHGQQSEVWQGGKKSEGGKYGGNRMRSGREVNDSFSCGIRSCIIYYITTSNKVENRVSKAWLTWEDLTEVS